LAPVIGVAPDRLFCVQVTLGPAPAGTPGPGACCSQDWRK